jgi:cellulose synthase/poly-beta-1,6-N-acetylglucosamine synthase-like glycosyltransferase
MSYTITAFWVFIAFLLYAYIGYGVIASSISFLYSIFKKPISGELNSNLPQLTLIIPAYNEAEILLQKINNSLALDYPPDLISIIVVTDGSTDNSNEIVKSFSQIKIFYEVERKGKMAAINRVMQFVETPIVVFSDANTLLNTIALREIVKHYNNEKIGGVAGEKKIMTDISDNLVGQGEGLYWQYESAMKQLDSDLYTVVAAAGELFSIRTKLYKPLPNDTILDDLVLAINTCKQGYRIAYEKNAYAIEAPSLNLKEERKRKIRIAAGAAQAVARLGILPSATNWVLNFQYFSRRIIRWLINPISLPIIYFSNLILVFHFKVGIFYEILFAAQTLFYIMALAGWVLYRMHTKSIILFVPFYFVFMNGCMVAGFLKQLFNKQAVMWDKAKRVNITNVENSP